MRKKLLGFHQETARSHVLLSDALELQNDFKSALKELEEALKIQKEVLGENHNSTKDTQAKMRRIMRAIMQDSNGKVRMKGAKFETSFVTFNYTYAISKRRCRNLARITDHDICHYSSTKVIHLARHTRRQTFHPTSKNNKQSKIERMLAR